MSTEPKTELDGEGKPVVLTLMDVTTNPRVVAHLSSLNRRTRLWVEADKLCHYCHQPTTLSSDIVPWQATVDHKMPRGRGGDDSGDNVVSACAACNRRRNMEDINGLQEGSLLHTMPVLPGGHRGWVTNTSMKGQQTNTGTLSTKAYRPHAELQTLRDARDSALGQLSASRATVLLLQTQLAEAQAALRGTRVRVRVVGWLRRRSDALWGLLEGHGS